MLGDVCDGALEWYATARGIQCDNVRFGSHDVDNNWFLLAAHVVFELQQPSCHFLEALFICDVVAEQARVGAAVVQAGNATETFLARGIPDLETNDGIRCSIDDALGNKGRADCGGGRGGIKIMIYIAVDEGSLANACEGGLVSMACETISVEYGGKWSHIPWAPSTTILASREELIIHSGVDANVGPKERWICMIQ